MLGQERKPLRAMSLKTRAGLVSWKNCSQKGKLLQRCLGSTLQSYSSDRFEMLRRNSALQRHQSQHVPKLPTLQVPRTAQEEEDAFRDILEWEANVKEPQPGVA